MYWRQRVSSFSLQRRLATPVLPCIPVGSRLYDDFERPDVNITLAQKRSWSALDVDYPVTGSLRLGAVGGYEEVDGAGVPASSSPVAWLRLEYSF